MPIYLINRDEVKSEAKQLLKTARVSPVAMTALLLGITLLLDLADTAAGRLTGASVGILSFSFSFVSIFTMLLGTVLTAGYARYCLCVQRGASLPYSGLFDAFPFAGRVILLTLLQGVLIALGLLLFIIPGIVLAFSYFFALYHLIEEPDSGVVEALRRSRTEMQGYKWQLFMLFLSFWPLMLLAAIAMGVCEYFLQNAFPNTLTGDLLYTLISGLVAAAAQLYLLPYMQLSQVGFYRRAVQHKETPPDESAS